MIGCVPKKAARLMDSTGLLILFRKDLQTLQDLSI